MTQRDFYQAGVGRVAKLTPLGALCAEHGCIIVAQYLPDDRMLRCGGLQYHGAALVLAPCAAAYLRHELECPFVRAEIGKIEHVVGIQNAYQTYPLKVKSFGYHLSAHQDIHFSLLKVGDDFVVRFFIAGSVHIHA